jgi:hypothetical protein
MYVRRRSASTRPLVFDFTARVGKNGFARCGRKRCPYSDRYFDGIRSRIPTGTVVFLYIMRCCRLIKILKNDKRAIFTAASHAQRATDFLNGLQRPSSQEAACAQADAA